MTRCKLTTLVGTSGELTTCSELATARRAGQNKWVLEFIAGNGFIPGVTRPDQIKDPANPEQGGRLTQALTLLHQDPHFGSLDWKGQPVDDGVSPRQQPDGRHFRGFPKVTFRYRIVGRTITFAPVIAKGCSTFRCAWAISMAYPGKTGCACASPPDGVEDAAAASKQARMARRRKKRTLSRACPRG